MLKKYKRQVKKLQTPSQKRSGKRQKEWSNISDF
jgi:hypothetical protein